MLVRIMVVLLSICSTIALAVTPCWDFNGDGLYGVSDTFVLLNALRFGTPLIDGKGDMDGRPGITLSDAQAHWEYIFAGFYPTCPPFPPYSILHPADTLFLPTTDYPAGTHNVAIPIILRSHNTISDYMVPLSVLASDNALTIDSVSAGTVPNYDFGLQRISGSNVVLFFTNLRSTFPTSNIYQRLDPGEHTLAVIHGHYDNPCKPVLVQVDTTVMAEHTFMHHMFGSQPYYQLGNIGKFTVIRTTTVMQNKAVVSPNPQYYYSAFSMSPIIDTVTFGNFPGALTASDINLSSVMVNGQPASAWVATSQRDFVTPVIQAEVLFRDLVVQYGPLFDTTCQEFTVEYEYTSGSSGISIGEMTVIGKSSTLPNAPYIVPPDQVIIAGDFNASGTVSLNDVVTLIDFIFAAGPAPGNVMIGDVNCSRTVNISDAVYLVTYLLRGGLPPASGC